MDVIIRRTAEAPLAKTECCYCSGVEAVGVGYGSHGVDADSVLAWLDNYCFIHPLHNFAADGAEFATVNPLTEGAFQAMTTRRKLTMSELFRLQAPQNRTASPESEKRNSSKIQPVDCEKIEAEAREQNSPA